MMEFISALVGIVLINIVLSGDNAIVIGMAAHNLPDKQRKTAILIGGVGAIGLRCILTVVATLLLAIPAVRLIGGLLLLYVAYSLMQQEDEDEHHVKASVTLQSAIITILVADFAMSLDNVLGVAACANGDFVLLIVGLLISMAIILFAGGIIATLMDKLSWLVYVGAALIVFLGAEMILSDQLLRGFVTIPEVELTIPIVNWAISGVLELAIELGMVVVVLLAAALINSRGSAKNAEEPTASQQANN
jgi:YjbE family integral membrane protein